MIRYPRCRELSGQEVGLQKEPVTVVVEDRALAETKFVGDLLHFCERSIPRIDSFVEIFLTLIRDLDADLYALQTPNLELTFMHS